MRLMIGSLSTSLGSLITSQLIKGEDVKGLKNELHFGGIYAFGDGDVNFALGDGLETIADGIFISAKNATGWESDGMYVGNYTDIRPGFGFNYDPLNVTISGGPRFYTPGSYAKLPSRTDWGGEIALRGTNQQERCVICPLGTDVQHQRW